MTFTRVVVSLAVSWVLELSLLFCRASRISINLSTLAFKLETIVIWRVLISMSSKATLCSVKVSVAVIWLCAERSSLRWVAFSCIARSEKLIKRNDWTLNSSLDARLIESFAAKGWHGVMKVNKSRVQLTYINPVLAIELDISFC